MSRHDWQLRALSMLRGTRVMWLIALSAVSLSVACVKQYEAPSVNDPHAIVKIRRAYHSHAGTHLSEVADLGDARVMEHGRAATLDDTQTTAVRVHPGNAVWQLRSVFSHSETRQVREQYTVQTPYSATETYNCGGYSSSGSSSYRSCSRQVTRYRSEQRWRTVTKQVQVTDASCVQSVAHLAEVGHVYLLQYSYTGHEVCSLQCIEQVANADGTFATKPCPATIRE